jgi:hypothetical protein
VYAGLYDKVRSYARILTNPAQSICPTVTATPGAAFQVVEDGLPFVYRVTNATRAGLTALNNVFRGHAIPAVNGRTSRDDDYSANIQVADLNALNALLAIIRWKRHLGYASESMSDDTVFKVYCNEIRNGDVE